MKISNSKKQLAKIISENGGWRDGAEFAWFQGRLDGESCHEVWFGSENSRPLYEPTTGSFHSHFSKVVGKFPAEKFDNWHQTIMSRNEYFHLHPAKDADDMPSEINNLTQVDDTDVVESKPTIEQLAADYRAKLEISKQEQEVADFSRDEAEAALDKLYQAGLDIGLDIAIASDDGEQEQDTELAPELVITDWRDLRAGDVVEVLAVDFDLVDSEWGWAMMKQNCTIVEDGDEYPVCLVNDYTPKDKSYWLGGDAVGVIEWRFICRP